MRVAEETLRSLREAADLVNSDATRAGTDRLDVAFVDDVVRKYQMRYAIPVSDTDCAGLRSTRDVLADVFASGDRDAGAEQVNRLLRKARFAPRLGAHDGLDWHVHYYRDKASLAERIAADLGMAFALLLVEREWERLKTCGAPDCCRVFLDETRNRSRLYCDSILCGNRMHVRRYREEKEKRAPAGSRGGPDPRGPALDPVPPPEAARADPGRAGTGGRQGRPEARR